MSTVLALVRDTQVLTDLQTRFADQVANGVASLGDRFGVFEGGDDLHQQLVDSDGVLAAVDETWVVGLGAALDALVQDPGQAEPLATTLLGGVAADLDPVAIADLGGWLAQFAPSVLAPSGVAGLMHQWASAGPCYDDRTALPPPVPPDSPLRAARFAGDPVLEACLAGDHRMMEPEEGRAVLKIQAALLDLGFALPRKGADGHFGAETGQAVSAFKARERLHPTDPVVGRGTMERLDQLLAS